MISFFRHPGRCSEKLLLSLGLLGRLVVTLVDGHRNAGLHQVNWDGKDVEGRMSAGGVYLFRLEAAGYVETKRMVLIK